MREVWLWEEGAIQIHVLSGDHYARADGSSVFVDLDVPLLASFLDRPTALQAVKVFREALKGSGRAAAAGRKRGRRRSR